MSEAQSPALLGGRYRLGASLGGGGMADVYRATDTRLGRLVAVKIFRAGTDQVGRARFEEEARLLAGMNHPGLVTVHDASATDAELFLVMELVNGENLADALGRGPLPAAQVLEVGRRLAEVLDYVHDQGIMHRDVKPSNVLLSVDGGVYLADFGISRLADAVGRMTGSGVIGTAAYMAPEQVNGTAPGFAADIYALGLVLLECLKGAPEYPGNGVETVVARLTRPPEVPEEVPEPLRSTLRAMTSTDPQQRPSAADCLAAFRGDVEITQRIPLVSDERTMPAQKPVHRPATAVYDQPLADEQPFPAGNRRWPLMVVGAAVAAFVVLLIVLGVNSGDSASNVPPLAPVSGPAGADRMPQDLGNLERLVHG